MVGFCTYPVVSLLWSRGRMGTFSLRDLADVLGEKSIFEHWVRRDDMVLRGRPKGNAK